MLIDKIVDLHKKLTFKSKGAEPARSWSNEELRKFAHIFGGDVVNVSGWEDRDKEGGFYREYFTKADSYSITNFSQHYTGPGEEITLDLEKDLPKDLVKKYDVVFNHTTLEHVFEIFKAFDNLCTMSKDVMIFIMPFIQQQHETDAYKDYWRMTPSTARKLFERNGMEVIYENYTRRPYEVNYIISVGSRNPEKWRSQMPEFEKLSQICDWAS